ncbi:MAG TPA: GNAT family N-acetyltransferase, partial [Ktedonobacteraceae bacterium]|nr:GNAT family N-acetyltransferase [Ktedonobacteraceae bacterium]
MIDNFLTDFHVRRPMMSDLEVVHRLLEACDIAEYGAPDLTLDDLRSMWQGPTFHLATDAWMVYVPGDQLVGYADVQHRQHVRAYAFVRVLPEFVGKGIEEHLLNLAEEWTQRQIPQAQSDARVTLLTWESSVNITAQQALLQAGFQEVRRSWRMEIGMSQAPIAPKWPDQVTVRTFKPGQDDRAVFEAIDEAFQDHWGHMGGGYEEWKHWTIERENFDPSLWFLAFESGEIAGASLCTYQRDDGWVDTLAVRRPWRRKGLGMALLLHSFGEFYRRGKYKVGLGVDSQNL